MLAPKAERVRCFPWKEPKERIPWRLPDPFIQRANRGPRQA